MFKNRFAQLYNTTTSKLISERVSRHCKRQQVKFGVDNNCNLSIIFLNCVRDHSVVYMFSVSLDGTVPTVMNDASYAS